MSSFAAQVKAFADRSQEMLGDVQRDAVQSLAQIVTTPVKDGGNMPVRTGFLRSSLRGSNDVMPSIDPLASPPEDAAPNTYDLNFTQIGVALLDWEPGQTFYLGFTAAYAQHQEAKRQFVGLAAQQWGQIVNRSVERLQTSLSRPS